MDFSNWPKMVEATQLAKNYREDDWTGEEGLLHECMRELTITVVAVNKSTSRSTLVLAQNDLAGTGSRLAGIDDMGDHAFCWPRGKLSLHSHGEIVTVRHTRGITSRENRESNASLGMKYTTVTYVDRRDCDRVVAKEIEWTLLIKYTLDPHP
mmetsp:Transcript_18768/g.40659  ORF Transcript_18768/g.40659 Transcript_18768/m.40659 type:complete len:153 (+) Transcript_18768:962-1420(+)